MTTRTEQRTEQRTASEQRSSQQHHSEHTNSSHRNTHHATERYAEHYSPSRPHRRPRMKRAPHRILRSWEHEPLQIVVMGVSGSGKSHTARNLAEQLGFEFVEGDELHPQANIEKMASGTPLTDEDRWPWLDSINHIMQENAEKGVGTVISCSALKKAYRRRLENNMFDGEVVFIQLAAPREVVAYRMSRRHGHFMPAELLDSQYDTLEPLEAQENGFAVQVTLPPRRVQESIRTRLELGVDSDGFADYTQDEQDCAFLTLDIGNTTVEASLVRDGDVFYRDRLDTADLLAAEENHTSIRELSAFMKDVVAGTPIYATVISSVVPRLSLSALRASQYIPAHLATPVVVDPELSRVYGVNIPVDPRPIGHDLLADCVAAVPQSKKQPVIIVDMGTATKFLVLVDGVFVGASIAPGMRMMADSLTAGTAQLPQISLDEPSAAISYDTESCMRSGVYFGAVGAIRETVARISDELASPDFARTFTQNFPEVTLNSEVLAKAPLVVGCGGYHHRVENFKLFGTTTSTLVHQGLETIGVSTLTWLYCSTPSENH